jgi:hypothetical protein
MSFGRLSFDTTDAGTIADSHHVGAHTLSGTGALISSGSGASDDVANTFEGLDVRSFMFGYDAVGGNWDRLRITNGGLDVNVSGPMNIDVQVNAERAEDSAHTTGDIGNFVLTVRDDGSYASATVGPNVFTAVVPGTIGNSISLVFTGANSVSTVVTAWNSANPANTVAFTGSGATVPSAQTVTLTGGSANTIFTNANYDYAPFVTNSTGALKVADSAVLAQLTAGVTITATNLDIRDLVHTQDSIRLGDGTGLFTSTTVGADLGLDVFQINDPSVANTAISNASSTLSVANTAQNVVASVLANRKMLYVYNKSNKEQYIGATGVTVANGFPLPTNTYIELRVGAAVGVQFVGPDAGKEIRTLQLA